MTSRYVCRALTVAALTCGVTATSAVVRAHDHDDPYIAKTSPKAVHTHHHDSDDNDGGLPKGHVTLVGCFIRTTDSDGDHATYVLANATLGPATTVADQNCSANGGEQLIKLRHVDDVGLERLASGRWIETYGELGKPRDADDMRKFEVKSFREVPLTPRIAIVMPPAPAPPVVETPPEKETAVETPSEIGTAGTTSPKEMKKLPKTASELPLVALLGLFAISGGLLLGAFDRRRIFGRL